MLNSTETPTGDSLVDIEGLEDTASPMKKIDFGLVETSTTEQGTRLLLNIFTAPQGKRQYVHCGLIANYFLFPGTH